MKNVTVEERFMKYIIRIPFCECWIWNGYVSERGYGKFFSDSKHKADRAHRVSYKFFNGGIPDGLHVLHKCDTPLCVNPEHLFLGTHDDNMKDMKHKKRAIGHKGESNFGAKLNETQVLEIRGSNLPYLALAKLYNLHVGTIENIVSRRTWKHI